MKNLLKKRSFTLPFILVFVLQLTIINTFAANTKTIKGKVVDSTTQQSMPGTSITVPGTTIGTVTDIDGNFTLGIPEKTEKIIVAFIGYQSQTVSIKGKDTFHVNLIKDNEKIDEVVVTALGISREAKKIGYAITEVKGETVIKANTVNPVSALQGTAAGVNIQQSDGGIFGGTKIEVRGVSTLDANNQPIYVVDGVILENDISGADEWNGSANDWGNQLKNLNPDDFESISILKGAAATALYGSRGINGAVVVTTKSGKGSGKITTSFSQTLGFDVVYRVPDLQYEYGVGDPAGFINYGEKDSNGNYYKWDTNQMYQDNQGRYSLINNPASLAYGPKYDGRDIVGYDGEMMKYSPYKKNMKQAFNTGFNTNTNISITGGTAKTSFYLSESFNYRMATYPGNRFTRNSLLLKGTHKLSDAFTVDGSITFAQSFPRNPVGGLGNNFVDGTFNGLYNTNKYKSNYTASHGGIPNSEFGDENAYVPGNGVWFDINNTNDTREETSIRPILGFTFTPAHWLTVRGEGNMNIYTVKSEKEQLGSGYANTGGYYSIGHTYKREMTGKLIGTFLKDFGDFSNSLMVGGELYKIENSNSSVNTDGGLIVPGKYFIGNSMNIPQYSGGVSGEKQINSIYYILHTEWRDQVFLDITGRNDWSSTLVYKDGTGDYSYFYPSFSGSWLMNKTFSMPAWVSMAKLRASWAQVGNDFKPYDINPQYSLGSIVQGNGNIYTNEVPTVAIDKHLKPEKKNSVEIGVDLRFLQNRIGIDVTWYKENTKNQIIDLPGNSWSGVSTQRVNAGNLQNMGTEIALHAVPVSVRGFEWSIDANITVNRNKILYLHPSIDEYMNLAGNTNYGNFRVGSVAYIGGEYGTLLSDSNPKKDSKGRSVLTWNDKYNTAYVERSFEYEKVGNIQPRALTSVTNSFKFKKITASFMLDMRFGGDIASYSNRYGTCYGFLDSSLPGRDSDHGGLTFTSARDNRTYHDGVVPDAVFGSGVKVTTPSGHEADVSGLTFKEAMDKGFVEPLHASTWTYYQNDWGTGVVNSDWVSKLSYISLRQVSVGYTPQSRFIEGLGMHNFYVGFDARNLCYIYNSLPNHLNPESMRGNSSSYSYFERTFSPYTATYSFTFKFDI